MTTSVIQQDIVDLLRKIAEKDKGSFAILYTKTCSKMYGVVYAILRRGDLAADALQDVYLKVWQKAPSFNPNGGSALGWMATIARNHAVDMIRVAKEISIEDMPSRFEPVTEIRLPGHRDRHDTLTALLSCLSQLEPRRREMILLAYLRGSSREELSTRFGLPVSTIKTHIRRTLIEIKQYIENNV